MSRAKMSFSAWQYHVAVHDFFSKISEISYIEGLRFERATQSRIFFYIDDVANKAYGHNYSMSVFVRKKNLRVEIYDEKTGKIITKKMLEQFKKDAQNANEHQ